MKRLAAIMAVLSVFAFAACGSEKKDDGSSAAGETVTQEAHGEGPQDISQAESEAPVTESEAPEEGGDNGGKVGSVKFTEGSVTIIMQDGEEPPELSDEELEDMTNLALKEYEAMLNDDVDGYFDCISLDGFFVKERLDKLLEGDEHGSVSSLVVNQYSEFALEASWSEDDEEDEGDAQTMSDYLIGLAKKATPENFRRRMAEDEVFSYQYTREDIEILKEEGHDGAVSENAVLIMLDPCIQRTGGDLYASFELAIFDGDITYDLNDVVYWSSGSDSGLYIDECFHTENEYKGMDAEQIIEAMQKGLSDTETEQSARAFYNAVDSYLQDSGKDIARAVDEGDFAKAASPEGLDLSGAAEAAGDKALLGLLEYYEYKGSVFVGNDNGYMFVQYKDDSGNIGQVPEPQNEDTQIVWGKLTE